VGCCTLRFLFHRAPGDRSLAKKTPPSTTKQARKTTIRTSGEAPAPSAPIVVTEGCSASSRGLSARLWTGLAVAGLLAVHLALAQQSLVLENPTVDEVVHLPAGVTYWQKGTFRLYHHNPPLVRMVAALPVICWGNLVTAPAYFQDSWGSPDPQPTTFSQTFAYLNSERYLDLFRLARMVMPLFSVVGGLAVFAWSRRLYGNRGALLSLCLWVFCPNILAHCRLITTDVGSTALGVAATFVFWLYLRNPSWLRAAAAGTMLGLAELTKFSMLLLYAVWPFLWLVRLILATPRAQIVRRAAVGVAHGLLIVVLSILVIDAGYRFEGVGIPLGKFEFASGALTRPVAGGIRKAPASQNPLYALMWTFRENRFRGTILAKLPVPLPEHYLLGFDEQKVEADGILNRLRRADQALRSGDVELARKEAASADQSVGGYTVYLNGVMRTSGWWYYYICTLLYKVPEGTWLLVLLSLLLLFVQRRTPEAWADEVCLWTVPVVVLCSMSFLTDINLGLRYVLSIAPYVFIAAGKVVPWVEGRSGPGRQVGRAFTLASLALTIASALWIHPHYLAYFNWVSGGPDRVPVRLIDSNLDWGQDLLGLRAWCRQHAQGQPIGLAYFGQINPSMSAFNQPGDQFDWFLPPVKPGSTVLMERKPGLPPPRLVGPSRGLVPGYYAVSASLVFGLPWRLYDPSPDAWAPVWNADRDAFGYFRLFQPIARIGRIGHSIYVYKLSPQDVERAAPLLEPLG
jgi:Dolichyl-phosphate-mannose-protein mannosyltransferase